ncbi:hypothetical protein PAPHI01_1713 [Pancytospora philotis]|nr:hypothetical protein PAPHI01_1713 [Pancytospora philotis]
MCGIFWSAGGSCSPALAEMLRRRGPDCYKETHFEGVFAASSVLCIRGSVPQPVVGDGYLLQYNGEVYNGSSSDTEYIRGIIDGIISAETSCLSSGALLSTYDSGETSKSRTDEQNLPSEGDFSFAVRLYTEINKSENELALSVIRGGKAYFFKDDVGRRSLGITRAPFGLSSVCYEEELDPMKLYVYDFASGQLASAFKPRFGVVGAYLQRFGSIGPFLFSDRHRDAYRYMTGYGELCCGIGSSGAGMQNQQSCSSTIAAFDAEIGRAVRTRLPEGDVVVFFSGGIDSVLVALQAHLNAPPHSVIHLVNTCFADSFDRAAGVTAHRELQSKFPARRFNFIENDLSVARIREHRAAIAALVAPKVSTMDLNIGIILYFSAMEASRYGKVALLGSGADEVFGGYSKYSRECAEASSTKNGAEFRRHMLFDLFTVSMHNICRDDRVIAHWGVEARFAFLDTDVIQKSLLLADDAFISGGENKHLLRAILRSHGLVETAGCLKKAMQYGSALHRHEKLIFGDAEQAV